ncbi:MAG: restriction endonuclease subunit S [Panacagrimonas sp.]
MQAICEFARRVSRPINRSLEPLDQLNVIAKINFSGELFLRSPEDRAGYKGQLFKALPGEMLISKIRAAQGSMCLVPEALDHVAVSSEYPTYRLDDAKVLPAFFSRLLREPKLLKLLTARKTGATTKTRLRPSEFEKTTIPLPPLGEQQRLLADLDTARALAVRLQEDAAQARRAAQAAFEAALGFAPPKPLPKRPVFVARYATVERWSHEGWLRAQIPADTTTVSPWPVVTLGDVAQVSYGLQKSPANRPSEHARPYLRVANVQRGRLDLREIKTINVPDSELRRFLLRPGDVLLCEGNSADLVGRGAIWNGEIEGCVHQNHVLRARPLSSELHPPFLLEVINSEVGQTYFQIKAKRTTNLSSINSKEVSGMPLPLPPESIQRKLVAALTLARTEADRLDAEATALIQAANAVFEHAVFGSASADAESGKG